MKHILTLTFLALSFCLFTPENSFAQTKKLLVFKDKAATASGTLKGEESKTFYFKIKKNTDMEISFDEGLDGAKFILYKPDGKLFYDDNSVNRGEISDLMDILEDAGTYKIIVKLPPELQSKNQSIKFNLRLVLR